MFTHLSRRFNLLLQHTVHLVFAIPQMVLRLLPPFHSTLTSSDFLIQLCHRKLILFNFQFKVKRTCHRPKISFPKTPNPNHQLHQFLSRQHQHQLKISIFFLGFFKRSLIIFFDFWQSIIFSCFLAWPWWEVCSLCLFFVFVFQLFAPNIDQL